MFVFVRPRTTRGQYTLCTSVPAAATVITCDFASSEFYRDRAFLVIYIKISAVTNFHTVRVWVTAGKVARVIFQLVFSR